MKILVCAKVSGGEVNPFDQSAIEWALRLSRDVTVLSMAPPSARDVLLTLTRLGAKVIHISDPAYAGSDTLATSYILAEAIRIAGSDLILCGKQSVDGDTAHVGPMLAARLGIPLIAGAMQIDASADTVHAVTRTGEKTAALPALLTVERSCVLRFPSIFSKPGEVIRWDNARLQCDESRIGLKGSPTRVVESFRYERGQRKCRFITRAELPALIEELKKTPRRGEEQPVHKEKLPAVWAVGEEVLPAAQAIAETVTLIEKTDAAEIAARAKAKQPPVILWNADAWGRSTAPQAAALLETGLSADCTALSVENGELLMQRPACAGSIYAKIRCLTKPVMATVRTKADSAEIVVAAGKGAADRLDAVWQFADSIHASRAASRALVEMGKADYSLQVGLTGRTVSPKIYIAAGISGAVQHTCAIEGADWVIAVNPDRDARIFSYADFGISEEF